MESRTWEEIGRELGLVSPTMIVFQGGSPGTGRSG